MEITMYEDGAFNNPARERESMAQMKRKFTLDFNPRSTKKIRSLAQPHFNPLLTSPDLNMLKLASPELDKLVLQNGTLLSTGFNFPAAKAPTPTVTQEDFIKGFEDTYDKMKNTSCHTITLNNVSSVPSSISIPVPVSQPPQYTQLEIPMLQSQHQVPVTTSSVGFHDENSLFIKEEPHTVPLGCGTPPVSPINMENQEKIKLERKRLRNRIAASKCRRRKLEKIGKLEDKVNVLKSENTELQAVVNSMRDQVCSLKQEVMQHVNAGCQIPFMPQQ